MEEISNSSLNYDYSAEIDIFNNESDLNDISVFYWVIPRIHGIFQMADLVVGHVGGAILSVALALFLVISLRRYFIRSLDQHSASREFILRFIDCHFQLAIITFLVIQIKLFKNKKSIKLYQYYCIILVLERRESIGGP